VTAPGVESGLSAELASLFARDITRLLQEVRAFPDTAALWETRPGVANAAGTLVLHLEGNLREYIGRQLGGLPYERDRPREFSARDLAREDLAQRLEAVLGTIPLTIRELSPERLAAPYPEPHHGAVVSTRQFLIHLLAHLDYHLGQVDYLRRVVTGTGAIELAGL
jgi:hypothetical protein